MVAREGRKPSGRSSLALDSGPVCRVNAALPFISKLGLSRLVNSLCLSLLICKMGIEPVPPHRVIVRIRVNIGKVLRTSARCRGVFGVLTITVITVIVTTSWPRL